MKSRRPRPLEVAVVGMACRFPGAPDLFAYWENILAGRDATGEVPADRWDASEFCDPDSKDNDRVACRRGGYLDPVPFDAASHGIMPVAVDGGEPEQFLVLDAARAALADAGMPGGPPDGRRVEVVIGRGNYFNRGNLTRLQHGRVVAQTLAILRDLHPDWGEGDLEAVRADLKAGLPPFGPATVPAQLTNATAGRLADRLDLSGASFVVDAASASSLVALDLAARSLADRRADLALAGGVYVQPDVDFPMVFSQLGALSRSGRGRPFAKDADGLLPGEGVGVVALKRLADAERDGDRIYAVLKGVGVASDGRGPGLASPSARGHARAIRRAYRRSGIGPATVGLIEGHGLGVPAADRAELRALRAVFPPSRRRALGAVSSMIGHAMPAAGMAGLIKTCLALHHRTLPPTLHADEPHPLLADDRAPCVLNRSVRPWVHGVASHPRRAGVNAFGFAGINAHAILEEHPASADGDTPGALTRWDSEAILLGAPDRASWLGLARALVGWLDRGPSASLKDLAYTLNTGQPSYPFRVGIVADSFEDLRERLRAISSRLADPSCRQVRDARGAYFWDDGEVGVGKLAFLFPGEGSQYPGMLGDLCPHFPEVRRLFDTADRIAIERGHARLPSEFLFGGVGEDDPALWAVGSAVNAVLSAQWALYQLLVRLGLRPDAVLGHSSGEFLALGAAGVLAIDRRFEDGLGELGATFEAMERSGAVPEATLVAVAADRERVESACREAGGAIATAMDNCRHQVVIAGPADDVGRAVGRLQGQGVLCASLPFARAYHTPKFAGAIGPIRDFFAGLPLERPRVPLYSCATAGRLPDDPEAIRALAVEQWTRPVRFREAVEALHRDGVRLFVEVGARGNLTGFVEDTLRDRPALAVAANLPRRSGLRQLNHLVAALFARGVAVRPDHLYARRRPERIDLGREPRPARAVPTLRLGFPEMRLSEALAEELRSRARVAPPAGRCGLANGQAEAHANGRGSSNGHAPAPLPNREAESPADEGMLAYLATMDEFLKIQGQVMGAYLRGGREGPAAIAPGEIDSLAVDRGPSAGAADWGDHGPDGLPTASVERAPAGAEEVRPAVGPWVGEVRSFVPGRELVAVRRLEMRGDPIAENHTLGGRRVSTIDPDRKGLPVLPFTVMAEMLAQAAAALAPGRALVALRDVQANRWIRYEEGPVALEVRANRIGDQPEEFRVAIYNRGQAGTNRGGQDGPVVEGLAVFGGARAPAPEPMEFCLEGGGSCRFTAEELYRDQWLFHGPALQALVRVGESSPEGIEGALRVLPTAALLPEGSGGGLLTDPIALDSFTHLLGCWGLDQMREGDVMFPLRLDELTLHGEDPPVGSEVACRIVVRSLERHRVRVDADLIGPGGRVWMRLVGWEDWRFHWPGRYRDVFRAPERILVGERVEVGDPGAVAVWLEPPADMGRPVWRDVLEWTQLGPEERAELLARGGPEPARALRLWGRIAAKEAARRLWLDRGGPEVFPADLRVESDPRGRPRLRSLLEPRNGDLPAISIAHTEGVAVALAAIDPGAKVGIDVERIAERRPDFEGLAFTPCERALLDGLPDRAEWVARLWCAKEAAAKATGLGLVGGPSGAEVVAVDVGSGGATVRLGPELASAPGGRGEVSFGIKTARRGDYAWAWTLGERPGEA